MPSVCALILQSADADHDADVAVDDLAVWRVGGPVRRPVFGSCCVTVLSWLVSSSALAEGVQCRQQTTVAAKVCCRRRLRRHAARLPQSSVRRRRMVADAAAADVAVVDEDVDAAVDAGPEAAPAPEPEPQPEPEPEPAAAATDDHPAAAAAGAGGSALGGSVLDRSGFKPLAVELRKDGTVKVRGRPSARPRRLCRLLRSTHTYTHTHTAPLPRGHVPPPLVLLLLERAHRRRRGHGLRAALGCCLHLDLQLSSAAKDAAAALLLLLRPLLLLVLLLLPPRRSRPQIQCCSSPSRLETPRTSLRRPPEHTALLSSTLSQTQSRPPREALPAAGRRFTPCPPA